MKVLCFLGIQMISAITNQPKREVLSAIKIELCTLLKLSSAFLLSSRIYIVSYWERKNKKNRYDHLVINPINNKYFYLFW